jgi:hypothetical protein
MRRALLLLAFTSLMGCGPTDYPSFCEHAAEAICQSMFRCWVDDARAQWGTITTCSADLRAGLNCTVARGLSCHYDPVASSRCLDDLDNIACEGSYELPASCNLECVAK